VGVTAEKVPIPQLSGKPIAPQMRTQTLEFLRFGSKAIDIDAGDEREQAGNGYCSKKMTICEAQPLRDLEIAHLELISRRDATVYLSRTKRTRWIG
jgi:hypothetical protein